MSIGAVTLLAHVTARRLREKLFDRATRLRSGTHRSGQRTSIPAHHECARVSSAHDRSADAPRQITEIAYGY